MSFLCVIFDNIGQPTTKLHDKLCIELVNCVQTLTTTGPNHGYP